MTLDEIAERVASTGDFSFVEFKMLDTKDQEYCVNKAHWMIEQNYKKIRLLSQSEQEDRWAESLAADTFRPYRHDD